MQRMVGAFLIILASTGIGLTKGMDLQKHERDLEMLKQIFMMLRSEIKYTKATLEEAFYRIGKRVKGSQREWLLFLAKRLEERTQITFGGMWIESIDTCLGKTKLKREDKDQLKALGMNMGYLDEEMQIGMIDMYLEQLESTIKKTREELAVKKKICNCLGVIGGIFLVIVLI